MLLLSFVGWASALYFWARSPISPSKSPSSGRSLNEDCVMFDYFDYHDIWHMLFCNRFTSSFFSLRIMADENLLALVPIKSNICAILVLVEIITEIYTPDIY